jgi:hypothetical protein
MDPNDVARASLAALARGEVVCVPALEDASALQRLDEAQRAVMAVATTPTLAARYR